MVMIQRLLFPLLGLCLCEWGVVSGWGSACLWVGLEGGGIAICPNSSRGAGGIEYHGRTLSK